jgi:hypothetical protein
MSRALARASGVAGSGASLGPRSWPGPWAAPGLGPCSRLCPSRVLSLAGLPGLPKLIKGFLSRHADVSGRNPLIVEVGGVSGSGGAKVRSVSQHLPGHGPANRATVENLSRSHLAPGRLWSVDARPPVWAALPRYRPPSAPSRLRAAPPCPRDQGISAQIRHLDFVALWFDGRAGGRPSGRHTTGGHEGAPGARYWRLVAKVAMRAARRSAERTQMKWLSGPPALAEV